MQIPYYIQARDEGKQAGLSAKGNVNNRQERGKYTKKGHIKQIFSFLLL